MINTGSKYFRAATPAMTAVSVGLHGLVILLLITWSMWPQNARKPNQTKFTRVTLVQSLPGHAAEALTPPSDKQAPPASEAFSKVKREQPTMVFEEVRPAAITPEKSEAIPLKKKKRSPRRLPDPEPKAAVTKKPAEKPTKKKEDPAEALEKRLASIRQAVDEKKKSSSALGTEAKQGGGTNGAGVDPELERWMRQLRSRINSHWAVIGQAPSRKITIIGVKISDDGALLDTTVDETSGDPTFDRSALRAVHQAAPFPRIPPTVQERIRQAGGLALRFTPGGIE